MFDTFVHAYVVMAIAYNVMSMMSADFHNRPLAPTDPLIGTIFITTIFLVYSADTILSPMSRSLLLLVYLGLITRFGVIRHLFLEDQANYTSTTARLSAAGINIFGVLAIAGSLLIGG